MTDRIGVVIPVGPGRAENLAAVLESLNMQTVLPEAVVLVCDGPHAHLDIKPKSGFRLSTKVIHAPKHEPGMEQPRNIGVRALEEFDCTHAWFLDSDVIVGEDCLEMFHAALGIDATRILIGPYDWGAPGVRELIPRGRPGIQMPDPRWASFDACRPGETLQYDLGAALANFSGNLVWPIDHFWRVGGFHSELHHGRCEDGELGLRAAALGVGTGFVAAARGFHLWHPVDQQRAERLNARDVPLINKWHPWVQENGLVLNLEEDGARFDWLCPRCGRQINTLDGWRHVVEESPR